MTSRNQDGERATKVDRKTTHFFLKELTADTGRFQDRSPVASGYSNYGRHKGRTDTHIRDMAEQIDTTGKPLDPMVVWKDPQNGRWFIVDGFHRYAAYEKARTWRRNRKVPCKVAHGTEEEVGFLIYNENRKAKLGFTQEQRLEFAWRKLWEGDLEGLSLRDAAALCSVGHESIRKMRKAAANQFSRHKGPKAPCIWREVKNGDEDQPEESTMNDQEHELREQQKEAAQELEAVLSDYNWNLDVLGPALEMIDEAHEGVSLTIWDPHEPEGDF